MSENGANESLAFQNQMQLIIYGVVFPSIVPIGLFFNICSFIVLTRTSMLSSINIYLAGLSLFDSLLLFFTLLLFPPLAYCEHLQTAADTWNSSNSTGGFWCSYFYSTAGIIYPITCTAQTGSVWTMVAISVDRFIAIRWPLKARDVLTDEKAKFFLVVIALGSILYNIPIYFELERDEKGILATTDFRNSREYITIYKGYCYLVFMFVGPALMTLLLNLFVTRAVRTAFQIRRRLSGREEKERRCTMTAVLVVGVFLLLNLLAIVNNFLEAMAPSFFSRQVGKLLAFAGNFLVIVNSVANFVIYYAMGLKFRRMFCKIFCQLCYTPDMKSGDPGKRSSYYGSFRQYSVLNPPTNSTIVNHKDSTSRDATTGIKKVSSVRRQNNDINLNVPDVACQSRLLPSCEMEVFTRQSEPKLLSKKRPLGVNSPVSVKVDDFSSGKEICNGDNRIKPKVISCSLNAFPQFINKIQDASTYAAKRWSYNEGRTREDPGQTVAFLDDCVS